MDDINVAAEYIVKKNERRARHLVESGETDEALEKTMENILSGKREIEARMKPEAREKLGVEGRK